MSERDTIVAVATPIGRGGVAIIRLSGEASLSIAKELGSGDLTPRVAHYGSFLDENDTVLDLGLFLYFKAPHSFTGEDVVELQCHGGPVVVDRLLQRVVNLGARLAEPGEFSKRAFLNEKLDLTQAEAIADLINSSSLQAAKLAIRSLQGEFAHTIHQFKEKLIELRLYIEGAIDFVDEDIELLNQGNIKNRLEELVHLLQRIQREAKQGHCLQEGVTVVIAGLPNAGKSSLLNALSGRESAIVTDIPGTTRDLLREYIHIDGIPLHIVDTAGLRKTSDKIEKEGVARALTAIVEADQILWVQPVNDKQADPRKAFEELIKSIAKEEVLVEIPPLTVITNKIDLIGESASISKAQDSYHLSEIALSAKTGEGVELLRQHLKALSGYTSDTEGLFLARERHLEAIAEACHALMAAQTEWIATGALELIAECLRQAQLALDRITGVVTSDDLLGEIFSRFCIGK
ncbi:MAG: tRNA uridine(34) 5-carboxymethylaminomethyl synthesis GTPase MnmE [Gammaproteobacteria bacterium]|jgi:tRNA modification GTPase|nr:tRNA uridine(34) 5-carboxymethylaminomethyl synthesis GTPase MnmE [Gammaproteobacteria bacterium]